MGLPQALAALKAVLDPTPGLTTVLLTPVETDPLPAQLPLAVPLVGAALAGLDADVGHLDRRIIVWPVELVCLVRHRSNDIAADLTEVYPWPGRLVERLDQHLTLNGTLAAALTFADPMMPEDPGVIGWRKQTYVGFSLLLRLPVRSGADYRA